MPAECYCLFDMKFLEGPASVVLFKSTYRFRGTVNAWLAKPLSGLEVGEIFALNALVFGIVQRQGSSLPFDITNKDGFCGIP
jgi:hypothetical protein